MLFQYHYCALFFLLHIFSGIDSNPRCINENGLEVDWFFMYKFANAATTNPKLSNPGLRYVYVDNRTNNWVLGVENITDERSALGRTVNTAIYREDLEFYFSYNDQETPTTGEPGETTEDVENVGHAHAKGVAAGNRNSAFWIFHSVPRLHPLLGVPYNYPSTAVTYAQHVFCVSSPNLIGIIQEYLALLKPNLQGEYKRKDVNVTHSKFNSSINDIEIRRFTGTGEIIYTLLVKTTFDANSDIYREIITSQMMPQFNVLGVQSWRPNLQEIPNILLNNKRIAIVTGDGNNQISWGTATAGGNDHSKWAIEGTTNNVCIGDLNRNASQTARGGGAVCFMNANLRRSLFNIAYF